MRAEILEKARTVMSDPGGRHNYFAWPTVVRLKDGRLALGASGWRIAHVCPFGKAALSLSEDEGKTWSLPAVALDTVLDDRDVGLCAFGESSLILTSFNNTRAFQRSRDAQDPYKNAYLATVTDEEEARDLGSTFRVSRDNGRTFGPVFHSPVTSPHGPCVLADGTLLWVGRVFGAGNEARDLEAWTVSPEGETAFRGRIPATGPLYLDCEPHALALPDGSILCQFRVQNLDKAVGKRLYTVFQTESRDGGASWETPRQILGDEDGVPPHLLLLSDGTLVSVYGRRKPPYGIRAMVSRDGGRSWETNVVLTDDGLGWDLGYPATAELKDGSLLTVFYAHETAGGPAVIRQIRWRIR